MMAIVCEACKAVHPIVSRPALISITRDGFTWYFCSKHVVVSRPGQPIEVDGKPLAE